MEVIVGHKGSTLSSIQGAVASLMGRRDAATRRQQSRALDVARHAVASANDARTVESKKGAPVTQTRRARRARRSRRARRDAWQPRAPARSNKKARTSRPARAEKVSKQKHSRDRALLTDDSEGEAATGAAATGAAATDPRSSSNRPAEVNPPGSPEGRTEQWSEAEDREATPPADGASPGPAAIEERPAADESAPAPRIPRRTRTLADVVQPGRVAPRPETQADALVAEPEVPASAPPEAEAKVVVERAPDSMVAAEARDETDIYDPQAAVLDRDEVDDASTQVVPMIARRRAFSGETRPISAVDLALPQGTAATVSAPAREDRAAAAPTARGHAPVPPRFLRAARRGNARLVLRVAIGHGAAGLALALGAGGLLVAEQPLGTWTLGLAAVVAGGGVAAYGLLLQRRSAQSGALVLVATQLGALAWVLVVIGPRLALVLILSPAMWLALRMGRRRAALVCGLGGIVVYTGFWIAAGRGAYLPLLGLDATGLTLLDASVAALGLGLTLAAVIGAASGRERSDAAARARLYELRLARAEIARLRDQAEVDGERLAEALALALRGRGVDPIAAEGPLSLVAEGVNAAAERIRTLQKDREDRLRLEGALRSLTRALERAWQGVPWSWPEASGTMLDELTALMRAHRPPKHRERRPEWPDTPPSFGSLPSVGASSWSSWPSADTSASYP